MSEQLRKFIEDVKNNPSVSTWSETRTKQAVVLRILQLLNWDIFNPDEVTPEYSVGKDRVDYSLRINESNKIFIEVKPVGLQFATEEKKQILNYADYQGVEMAILTNGINWDFYLPHLKGNWEERRFYTIDLMKDDVETITTRFNVLIGRDSVKTNEYIKEAEGIYEEQSKQRKIEETLPKAWDNIINEPDDLLVELVKDTTEKLCGYRPNDEQVRCFLKKVKDESGVVKILKTSRTQTLGKVVLTDEKLSRKQLRNLIIIVIYEFGGKTTSEQVIDTLEKKYKVSQFYSGKDSTGERWRHAIHSERMRMVNIGLIKKNSERGFWELSPKGIELAKQLTLGG